MKKLKILIIPFILLSASMPLNKENIHNNKINPYSKTHKKSSKTDNLTINIYKRVMKNYTDEEVSNFFEIRGVKDDTRIIAEKNGGFLSSLNGKEGHMKTVLSTPEGDITMDLSDHSQSATVGEIKQSLSKR